MNYKDRNAKDRKILVGIAQLSLPERFKRIQKLELALTNAEVDVEKENAQQSANQKAGNPTDG
jgi:hypothetical protein